MTQFKLENHNAVALLNRLRIATRSTTQRERRSIFNGLTDALKGLGMVSSKEGVQALYEGIDRLGNHWFMADTGDSEHSEAVQALPRALYCSYHHAVALALDDEGRVKPCEICLGERRP